MTDCNETTQINPIDGQEIGVKINPSKKGKGKQVKRIKSNRVDPYEILLRLKLGEYRSAQASYITKLKAMRDIENDLLIIYSSIQKFLKEKREKEQDEDTPKSYIREYRITILIKDNLLDMKFNEGRIQAYSNSIVDEEAVAEERIEYYRQYIEDDNRDVANVLQQEGFLARMERAIGTIPNKIVKLDQQIPIIKKFLERANTLLGTLLRSYDEFFDRYDNLLTEPIPNHVMVIQRLIIKIVMDNIDDYFAQVSAFQEVFADLVAEIEAFTESDFLIVDGSGQQYLLSTGPEFKELLDTLSLALINNDRIIGDKIQLMREVELDPDTLMTIYEENLAGTPPMTIWVETVLLYLQRAREYFSERIIGLKLPQLEYYKGLYGIYKLDFDEKRKNFMDRAKAIQAAYLQQ